MTWGKKCLRLLGWLCGLAAIGGPWVLVLLAEIDGVRSQRFFCIDWETMGWHLLFLLIFLLPPIILTIWVLLERRWGKLHRGIGVLMFIVYLISVLTAAPLGLLGLAFSMPYGSRTEDIAHYLQLDDYTNVEEAFVRDFFPAQPGTQDAVYRYYAEYNTLDYELYARWTLPVEALEGEIARVEAALAAHGKTAIREQRGGFTCLVSCLHEGDPYSCMSLFAWHPVTGEVCYYDCDNPHGEPQPLWLKESW